MKTSRTLLQLIATTLSAASHLAAQTSDPSTEWSIQVVDRVYDPAEICPYVSLAFATGNPVLAYADYGNNRMKVAAWTGSAWGLEAISNHSGSVSLAMDRNNQPTFAWAYANLFFSAKVSKKWSTTTVDRSAVETYAPPSLAYDGAGNPSVSYRIRHNGREGVGFASRTGSTWTTSVIDGRPAGAYYTYSYSSLAFDPTTGQPAIAYIDDINDDANLDTLKFAKRTSLGWDSETIESTLVSGGRGSVALAYFAGQPVIADCVDGSVRLSRRQADGSWTQQLVDSGVRCDLCTTNDGAAYLAYVGNGALKVATAILPAMPTDPTDWSIQLVDSAASNRCKPSIKLGPASVPYVAYFVRGEVRVAKKE